MKNLGNLMKQAKEMQQKMADMQKELESHEITGEAGAGMVSVTLSGKGDMRGLKIDPKLMDPEEVEMLEDLLKAAHADARAKVDAFTQEQMKGMTGGIDLPPGMQMPF